MVSDTIRYAGGTVPVMRVLAAGVMLLVTAAACSDAGTSSTDTAAPTVVTTMAPSTSSTLGSTAPPITSPATTLAPMPPATTEPSEVTPQGFDRVAATAVTIDGTVCELCLWMADNEGLRATGLMYATELGAADGMLFEYPGPTSGAFWMKNTLMPLSIAFYDATGAYLDSFDMEPCTADPCPTYPTPNDFVYAIETTQGGLDELGLIQGSLLTVTDLPCE